MGEDKLHRVDRMGQLEAELLDNAGQRLSTDVEFLAQSLIAQEAQALALLDIANSLRVWLYGPVDESSEEEKGKARRVRSERDAAKDRIKSLESERMRVWKQLVELRDVIPPEGNFDLRRSLACIAEGSAWSPSDMRQARKEPQAE